MSLLFIHSIDRAIEGKRVRLKSRVSRERVFNVMVLIEDFSLEILTDSGNAADCWVECG